MRGRQCEREECMKDREREECMKDRERERRVYERQREIERKRERNNLRKTD